MEKYGLLIALSSVFVGALARPDGAPAAACANIFPEGHVDVPRIITGGRNASLDVAAFNGSYIPGATYTLNLTSPVVYLGLLVQARLTADGRTPVGKFIVTPNVTKLSNCNPANSAVTHITNDDKNNVPLQWTAPSKGTGPVTFFYAVVVNYDVANGENTFYATLKTASIRELNGAASVPFNIPIGFLGLISLLSWQASRLF